MSDTTCNPTPADELTAACDRFEARMFRTLGLLRTLRRSLATLTGQSAGKPDNLAESLSDLEAVAECVQVDLEQLQDDALDIRFAACSPRVAAG